MSDYVLDDTFIPAVNAGSEDAIRLLNHLRRIGATLHMTRETYTALAHNDANRRLLKDLGIQYPVDDKYASSVVMRERLSRFPGDRSSAALVLTLNERLRRDVHFVTADRLAGQEFGKYYGKVRTVEGVPGYSAVPNYNEVRRRLQLRPLIIVGDGKVLKQARAYSPKGGTVTIQQAQPQVAQTTQSNKPAPKQYAPVRPPLAKPPEKPIRTNPADSPNGQTARDRFGKPIGRLPHEPIGKSGHQSEWARTGQPKKVDPSLNSGPKPGDKPGDPARPAQGTGARLFFQGVNYIIQAINDGIQKERFEKRWDEMRPGVEAMLKAEPTMGALVLVYYFKRKKMGAENESPMEHTHVFSHIRVGYGFTRADARAKLDRQTTLNAAGIGQAIIDDSIFIPPKEAVDYMKLDLSPFQAEGIATFVPGMEAFLHLQWTGFSRSFQRRAETKFKLGATAEAIRFLYLAPPSEIQYFRNNTRYDTEEIDWDYRTPGEISNGLGFRFPGMPAIDTSSMWSSMGWHEMNRENAKRGLLEPAAAVVYPINDTTVQLFKGARELISANDEFAHLPIFKSLIRFVHPRRLHVLKYFGA